MLIGIGGLSRSGKTKLARRVKGLYKEQKVILLHQDDFVKAEADIPLIQNHIDWEVPASIDLPKWKSTIEQARREHEVVILEGIFIFAFPEINAAYDKSIFVEIPRPVFLERKRVDLRWGKEPEWYIQYIWGAYQRYGLPPKELEVYRVSGNRKTDMEALQSYLGS